MPSGPTTSKNFRTPFGKNVFLRSTRGILTESYTCAKSTIPSVTIDGSTEYVLQPGTLLAKITSGADNGKVGPYDNGASDGRQVEANVVGLCITFLPWQLADRDVEVAVAYACSASQSRCFEVASGAFVVLSDLGRDSCQTARLQILFTPASTELGL